MGDIYEDLAKIANEQKEEKKPFNTKEYIDEKILNPFGDFSDNQKIAYNEQQEFIKNLLNVASENQSSQNELVSGLLNPPTSKDLRQAELWNIAKNPTQSQSQSDTFPRLPQETLTNDMETLREMSQNAQNSPTNEQVPQAKTGLLTTMIDNPLNSNQYGTLSAISNAKLEHKAIEDRNIEIRTGLEEIAKLEKSPEELAKAAQAEGKSVEDFTAEMTKVKSNLQKEMESNVKRQNNLHENAEVYRQLAIRAGVPIEQLELLGSGTTYEQAQRALDIGGLAMKRNLLYGDKYSRSRDEFSNDEYHRLINEGYSHNDAEKIADRNADLYARERNGVLNSAMTDLGITGNAINNFGMQIARKIAEDNPQTASTWLSTYGLPINEYNNAFTKAIADLTNAYSLEKLLQQQAGQMNLQNSKDAAAWNRQKDKQNFDWQTTVFTENNKFALAEFRAKHDKDLATYQSNLRIKEEEIKRQHSDGKISDEKYKAAEKDFARAKDLYNIYQNSGEVEKSEKALRELEDIDKKLQILGDKNNNITVQFSTSDDNLNIETIKKLLTAETPDEKIEQYGAMYGIDRDRMMMLIAKARATK